MKNRKYSVICLLALCFLCPGMRANAQQSHDAAVARMLNTFTALVKELERNYVDTIRSEELLETAVGAMLSTVDPYTEYYTAEQQQELTLMQTGEYGGVGSYIVQRADSGTYVSGPYEGSPAALVGLKAGDRIVRIDSTDTRKIGSQKVSDLLKGQPGSIVNVEVIRPYAEDSVLNFAIERKKVKRPSVPYWGVIDGRTGYIQLTGFIEDSPKEVREALESFKANPEVKEVVLDLRGNGGGLVESAVEIVGNFVPKGTEVLRTKGRDKLNEKIYKTTKAPLLPDIPLAVLIDGGSASSSEITAGALQDLDRAVLVGSRSYGKGLVQSTRPLPYDGVLKVTVAKYYIPSGRLIQALDYSRRNPDGSVARTPDSLTNVYKTAHGREVRDGGGLIPDSTVDWGTVNRLVYNLVRDNIVFDFATKYLAEHPDLPAPEDFEITDEIYNEFKAFVDPSQLKYDKVCEELVKQLKEVAKAEGYVTPEVEQQLDALGQTLKHDLNHDLDQHRDQISTYLSSELMQRKYYERGEVRQSLNHDKGFNKAVEILRDRDKLASILGQANPKGK